MPTPSDTGPQLPIHRSATLPTRLIPQHSEASSSSYTNDGVLFSHPSAKIVQFAPQAPPGHFNSTLSVDFDYPVDTIETLPWRSPMERTVAVGRLRLENGMTTFLKCGVIVQPIMKNSQCWCVDGKSTFVLRIRSLTYYRIELPNETEEDGQRITQFKDAILRVLRYEVTPCPFRRGFSVKIPVEARTPKKKKAWRPKSRRESAPAIQLGANWPGDNDISDVTERPRSAGTFDGNLTDDSLSTAKEALPECESPVADIQPSTPIDISYQRDSVRRSVTETPQSVNHLLAKFQPIPESDSEAELNLSSSVESFHSLQDNAAWNNHSLIAWQRPEHITSHVNSKVVFPLPMSPLPPSPPSSIHPSSPDESPTEISYARQRANRHSRDISEITMTPDFVSSATQTTPTLNRTDSKTHVAEESSADRITSDSLSPRTMPQLDVTATGVSAANRLLDLNDIHRATSHRPKAPRIRDLSPMPPQSNLSYPAARESAKHLTTSIFQKTCSLVLVPPLQLLLLLIHITARIAAGHTVQSALSDTGPGPDSRPIDGEDDYGLPTTPNATSSSVRCQDDSSQD